MSKAFINTSDRQDDHGKIVFMCRSGGYVMCRRPRCMPFVLPEKKWGNLDVFERTAIAQQDKGKETV